jgi:hypothetical protein
MDRTRTTTAAGRIMAALYSPSRASSPICDELTTRIIASAKPNFWRSWNLKRLAPLPPER